MPPKLHRSIQAKRLLQSYTQYSRSRVAFAKARRKYHKWMGPPVRKNLRDDLQSMSSEVKLLSDDIFEVLQPDLLQEDISGSSSNASSDGDSGDEVSNEDTSDDLDWIDDEDVSMSYTSSDGDDNDNSDDSTLSDDELNTLDSDTENAPPSSFHMQAFNELKQMYAHRYNTPH